LPLPLIKRVVGPVIPPDSIFLAAVILACELGTVWPVLFPFAVLEILHPLSFVLRSVGMQVHSVALTFVVVPFSLVDVAA
jgi:hypothetical protein